MRYRNWCVAGPHCDFFAFSRDVEVTRCPRCRSFRMICVPYGTR